MDRSHTPLLAAINAVMILALAAMLTTPMVVFYAALAGAPVMLVVLFTITLTTRAAAPAPAASRAAVRQGTSR